MRQTFVDDELHAALIADGFVKLRIMDERELAGLAQEFDRLRPADGFDPPGGAPTNPMTYHCTFLDTDATYKREFDALVRRWFASVIEALFDRYTLLIANCYAKQPGKGEFEVHQNWNLTPDPRDVTVTAWVPLAATDDLNGTLMVVPGSHKLTRDIAHPRGGHYFSDYHQRIARERFEAIPLAAGEAVFFDDSLIHGSAVNRSSAPRFALQIEAIPEEADPVVYFPRDDSFDLLSAPASFYLETTLAEMDEWPERFERRGSVPNRNRRIPEAEFDLLLARGNAVRSELWGFPESPPGRPARQP